MSEREDIEALAGEYVLGTLDAAERRSVKARLVAGDAALAEAVGVYERQLSPLIATIPPADPPADLFQRILARIQARDEIDADPARAMGSAKVIALEGRARRWRGFAIAASAMAAALLLVIGAQNYTGIGLQPTADRDLVAVLQSEPGAPAYLVHVNLDTNLLSIRQISGRHQPGRSLQLWIAHESTGGPRSLGLIDDREVTVLPARNDLSWSNLDGALVEISLEPSGGSPTGRPTGPILFISRFLQKK